MAALLQEKVFRATIDEKLHVFGEFVFERILGWFHWNPPGGGAPPPTHSWRICDRGLVLAGVLGVLGFLGILAQNLEKIVPEPSQIEARGLKNRVQRLQNRARSPSRGNFSQMFNLRGSRGACSRVLPGLKSQLGSKLEAQDPPKSRPKPEKIDVKKQHVFGIDFGRVRTLFWKGFR